MTGAKRVLVFDGIGENGPHTMSLGLANMVGLPVTRVQYNRSYGPVGGSNGQAYARTLAEGQKAGRAILADGIPSVLIGFSAGAHIAGNLLHQGHPAIVGGILIADPMQPAYVTNDGLSGIAGQYDRGLLVHRPGWPKPVVPVRWVWNPRDVICQCPADSPLHDFADFTAMLSLNAVELRAYVFDVVRNLGQRIQQPAWLFNWIGSGRRYQRAIDDVRGYLPPPFGRGDHVKYGGNWLELSRWARTLPPREVTR